jgi:hypothetical protein
MKTSTTLALVAVALVVGLLSGWRLRATERVDRQPIPRAADGKPEFTGLWQAMNTASFDLQDHSARLDVPAGVGVVEGNEIPYQPWALEQRKKNLTASRTPDPVTHTTPDPVSKCYMPGVPRATYMSYPFQIVETPRQVAFAYEFARTSRTVYMNSKHEEGLEDWMGDGRGSWDGDTLVVDTVGFNDQTWFDGSGNFHSEQLHVVERFSYADPSRLDYEVTIEDPKVFTRAWKMSMPLYRRLDKGAQLLEYHCLEFMEPFLYGSLSRPGATN